MSSYTGTTFTASNVGSNSDDSSDDTIDTRLYNAPSRVRLDQYKSEFLLSTNHLNQDPNASASILYSSRNRGAQKPDNPPNCLSWIYNYYDISNLNLNEIWKVGSLQSAIQKGIAAMLSVLVAIYISIYMGYPDASMAIIAGVSAHITVENTMGDTTCKGIARLSGTVVGGLICLVELIILTVNFKYVPDDATSGGASIVNPMTTEYKYVYLTVLFVLLPFNSIVWTLASLLRKSRSHVLFCLYCAITGCIILASVFGTLNMQKLLVGRIFGVLIGIVIALFTKQLFFPRRTRSVMIDTLSQCLFDSASMILPLLQLDLFGLQPYPENYTIDEDKVYKFECSVDSVEFVPDPLDPNRIIIEDPVSFYNWFDKKEMETYKDLWSSFHKTLLSIRSDISHMADGIQGHRYEFFDLTQCLKTKRRVATSKFDACQKSMLSYIDILIGVFFSFDLQLAATDLATSPDMPTEHRQRALCSDFKLTDYFTPKVTNQASLEVTMKNLSPQEIEAQINILKEKFSVIGSYFTEKDYSLLAHCSFDEYDRRSEWLYNNALQNCINHYAKHLNRSGFLAIQIVVVISLWLPNYQEMPTNNTLDYLKQCHRDLTDNISEFTKSRIARRGQFSLIFSGMYQMLLSTNRNPNANAHLFGATKESKELINGIDDHFGLNLMDEYSDQLRIGGYTLSRDEREYIQKKLQHTLATSYWHGYFLAVGKIHSINKWLESLGMECEKLINTFSELIMAVYGKNY